MNRWFGKVGFGETYEASQGVWKDRIVERNYYGDIEQNNRRLREESKVNDDLSVTNRISIVADPYAMNTFHQIRYIEFMGSLWRVNSVGVQYPRLVLEVGGVYNGETPEVSGGT